MVSLQDLNKSNFNEIIKHTYDIHKYVYPYINSPKNVLDVGCNNGQLRFMFPNSNYFGIDFINNNQKFNFRVCDVDKENLPFENNTFDNVFCIQVLEHLQSFKVLKEIYRVLDNKGRLYITVPNSCNIKRALNPLIWKEYYKYESKIINNYHINSFSERELISLLKHNGFKIEIIKRFNNRIWKIHLPNNQMFQPFGMNIFVEAIKD